MRLIWGVGINDADYTTRTTVNGVDIWCPYYATWHSMMRRCYSTNYKKRFLTYVGCTVCEAWLTFSSFKAWMQTQDWRGKQLDKDLLVIGNKVYNPDTCIFVPQALNKLLSDHAAGRGPYPQGVRKYRGRFQARISEDGYSKPLGWFDTPAEASAAYNEAKVARILNVAEAYIAEPKLYRALLRQAARFGECNK